MIIYCYSAEEVCYWSLVCWYFLSNKIWDESSARKRRKWHFRRTCTETNKSIGVTSLLICCFVVSPVCTVAIFIRWHVIQFAVRDSVEMAEVADKGGGEIKHVEDILKSTEKDEVKFGLLVGLIKADQVSNKDVVNTVLHLVSKDTINSLFFFSLLLWGDSHPQSTIAPQLFSCLYIDFTFSYLKRNSHLPFIHLS